jgi:hypothetical protein
VNRSTISGRKTHRTSIGVRQTTKDRLDGQRAPGQCYDGFICQLMDLWEKAKGGGIGYLAGSAGGNQGAEGLASTYRLK